MEPLIGFGLGCFQTFVDQSVFLLGKLDELGEAIGLNLSKEMGLDCLSPREAVGDGMDQAVNVVDGNHEPWLDNTILPEFYHQFKRSWLIPPSMRVRRLRQVRGICAPFRTR